MTKRVDIDSPLVLPNGQVLANRVVKAAMTEGLADGKGRPTNALCRLYERWSQGGPGLLITGNTAVDAQHLERAGNVVIDGKLSPDTLSRFRALARAGQSGGSKVWVQISHAGRQTPKAINTRPRSPSAIPMRRMPLVKFGTPVEMSAAEIAIVLERFVSAAVAAEAAGFDGVQIHAAHGYLLSSFLSPRSNQRADAWGGDLRNRAELLLQIVERVRVNTSAAFAVSVKLNAADFLRGGFDLDDSVLVAEWLDVAGIDMLEISGGTYEAARMMGAAGEVGLSKAQAATAEREAYFLEFAPRIRRALRRASLMVTGGFRTRALMTRALNDDNVDLIGLARPLLVEPEAAAALMKGAEALPRIEDELRVGPGVLSPQSRFSFLKALNASAAQAWYYEQMDRLGAGLKVDGERRVLRAAASYIGRDSRKRRQLEL